MNDAQPQSLFLADSDDEDVLKVPIHDTQDAPPVIDVDIDAIFADVEDDQDDLFTFKPLAPTLDTEALRREAELRHKNNVPDLTPHAILPSSSPPRDAGAEPSAKSKQGGREAGKEAKKERRKPARLDEGRLLGLNGFPLLIKNTKNFKTKGKGHEATDLNRLLQVYQFWTHEMYPRGQFRDTVERVEKLCHSKRMNVSLSVWRDEAHGLIHGKKVEDDETIELDDRDGKDETVNLRSSSGSVRAEYASSSSPLQTRPPSSEVEDDDDDFDIDAVIRAEVERNARKRAEAGEGSDNLDKGKGKMAVADEDEYDALWNEMDPIPSVPASVESSMVAGGSGDDDMAIWDAVDALEEGSSAPTKPPTTHHLDDDEDMWDVVQEMENAPTTKAPPIFKTSTENATVVDQPPPPQDDDDDWEDMYV